jgi:N-acylneuraminate cytidylyltransferase
MVEAVVDSKCFDKVIVSTDSASIYDAVKDLPVEWHMRPAQHATVKATALAAMINLMENTREAFDEFGYFLPTCPFIAPEDIVKGTNMLSKEVDFCVSMTEIQETIQLSCLMKDDWVLPVFDNLECGLTNSKFIKKYFKPSGAFYIGKWKKIIENKNFFKGNVKGVLIPHERSVDINTVNDIIYAESLSREIK